MLPFGAVRLVRLLREVVLYLSNAKVINVISNGCAVIHTLLYMYRCYTFWEKITMILTENEE